MIVAAGEDISKALQKIKGSVNRWRLLCCWQSQGATPQVIGCPPIKPLYCKNPVAGKTKGECGCGLTHNSSELRGPTMVDGVLTFFMVEVYSCPDCAGRRREAPAFKGQVSHRILTKNMIKNSSHLSETYETAIQEDIAPGQPVEIIFSEEQIRRIKRNFAACAARAMKIAGPPPAPAPEPQYQVPEDARRDRRDSGRERLAGVVAAVQAFTAKQPGVPLKKGWYSRLLQFFADVNGDTTAVPG